MGVGRDRHRQQFRVEYVERCGLDEDLPRAAARCQPEPSREQRQAGSLDQSEDGDQYEDDVEHPGAVGDVMHDREGGQHDRHGAA